MIEHIENRPKLLIIGHARHGKDTVAEMLRDQYGLSFASSSHFVAERCIWPTWGAERYDSFDEMFEDRVNHRELWSNLINAYNTPDLARTGREMIRDLGLDMYIGMRDKNEYQECMNQQVFDVVVWVDGSRRKPPEDNPKMTMTQDMADVTIDNNGTLEDLEANVAAFVMDLNKHGFSWVIEQEQKPPACVRTLADIRREAEKEEMAYQPDFNQPHPLDPVPTPTPVILPEKVSEPEEIDMMLVPDDAVQVLDHGYVSLMDVFGTDDDIAEAARLSYGRGTKKVNKNAGLINYLYSHAHTSPFEMVEMKFQMRLPIFVMRQWVRHRTANLNEYSGRYSIMPRLWYTPEPEAILLQDTVNKQGSSGALDRAVQEEVSRQIWETSNNAFNQYEDMVHTKKVSREMARIVLPLNTYTEIVWKMDLNNMLKFLWLRDDSHAQPEIQAFARVIAQMVEDNFPLTYAAYLQSRESITFTRDELLALMTGDRSKLSKSQTAKSFEVQEKVKAWLIEDATN